MKPSPTLVLTSLLSLSVWAGALSPVVHAEQPAPRAYRVITHPDNQTNQVSKAFLRDAFLKKRTRWPDGSTIHPADLHADYTVRHRFSENALGRTVSAVKAYWQQRVFAGRETPPPEFAHEQAVLEYVREHDGAIGYVSPNADLDGLGVVAVH